MSAFTLANEMDHAPTLRSLLLERERLAARLAALGGLIDATLADPDTDLAGVKVTERHDIRVTVRDKVKLDRHLFATGRHRYVVSTIKLPGCTEQDLYDALQHVHGVVGPIAATAGRSVNAGSLKAAIRRMKPAEVAALPGVEVTPTVTRSAQLAGGDE